MMTKHDRKIAFTRAHEATRKIKALHAEISYRDQFALCLKAEFARLRELKADTVARFGQEMEDLVQQKIAERAARRAARKAELFG